MLVAFLLSILPPNAPQIVLLHKLQPPTPTISSVKYHVYPGTVKSFFLAVELFVPGQHLPAQEVTRWNTELSTGIPWSIESVEKSIINISLILNNLPQLISSHPRLPEEATRSLWIDLDHTHQLCVSEEILKTAGNLSLITPDMVNMDQVSQPRKASAQAGSHILAPNLATFFAPPKVAYTHL
ncbi:hypothetical protein PGTUg99_008870 [Puccinia graminis f. sp. tritici]|uniref:Uncharacterized protein n=1 Tax=Puccinia graminis f. sp. tritici TaxID=56615 RepID=A0A5B0S493_PUCGR|nr:hypothetical protein PGTUg99_008870 [Puccinia graminis f. sp. tritici]